MSEQIKPLKFGRAICPYCGVGCAVDVQVLENRILKITASDDAPPNYGRLCPKGAYLSKVIDTSDRLAYPMIKGQKISDCGLWISDFENFEIRNPQSAIRNSLTPVSWSEAIDYAAERLEKIMAQFGPDSVAFYGSGQLDTETCYVMNKLFKGFIGTNNTDSNSRLCMSSAVAGYRLSLGSDGPPTCYDDIKHAELFLIIGANMAENHPVLFQMLKVRRQTNPNVRIIVVDPRRTLTAKFADVHVSLAPGGDIAFCNALAKLIIERNACDLKFIKKHTSGFEEFKKFILTQNLGELVQRSGISKARIEEVVELLIASKRILSFYCMGANQSTVGTWKNNSIINLHLLLGQIGEEGAGPFSLTGQPNAMGGRESGYLSHQLPGYRFVDHPQHRHEVEKYWGLNLGSVSEKVGLTAVEMFEALETGKLKAIWIAATNPLVSMPDLNRAKRALEAAELVIVQDCYHPTETTQMAHVLFPAAQWGEKIGTTTNSERLVSRSQRFLDPPGVARPDWWILCKVAQRLGFKGFDFQSSMEVWDEYRHLTAGTLCDQSGMTHDRLEHGPLRWPCPNPKHPGTARLYLDKKFHTPDGRAKFWPRPHKLPAEMPNEAYPLILTTGRIASQWHSRTRTGKVPELVRMEPEPYVELNPNDAERLGAKDGDLILLMNFRGKARVKARVTDRIREGTVFVPFHWGDSYNLETAANYLTISEFDPISKQPELKFCAVRLEMKGQLCD